MRFFLAILLMTSSFSWSQQFELSETYQTKNAGTRYVWGLMEQSFDTVVTASIVLANDTSKKILDYYIKAPDTYDSTLVYEITKPGLKNVKYILKIQVESAACCYNIYCSYYIVTKKDELIPLPNIDYVMCDWPMEVEEYFVDSGSGTISLMINSHGNDGEITNRSLSKIYKWDGKKLVYLAKFD